MKVFHGSTIIVKEPLVHVGRKNLDFGEGFYVTNLQEQAISWANRPLNAQKPHILNVYEFDRQGAIDAKFRCLHFDYYDSEWLSFVVGNRQGKQLWKDYDFIEGGIANDRVFNTIELYSAGLIPQQETLNRLRYEKPNHQICILHQSVVERYLHFIEAITIKQEF